MKKLSVFAIVAMLLMGLAANASAADIKVSGKWQIEAQKRVDNDFNKENEENNFDIQQRVRTAFTFIANENLKGVLDTQIGTAAWGNNAMSIGSGRTPNVTTGTSGATIAGDGNIMLRQGYVDFKWPGTKVQFKVGYQTLALPAAFGGGSAILDDQVAAAVMVAPVTDNVTLLAGYARPYDNTAYGAGTTAGVTTGHGTSTDVLFAAVPLSFKGVSVIPFAAYGNSGYRTTTGQVNNVATVLGGSATNGFFAPNSTLNEGVRAYFGGVAATITAIDNFKIMADLNYGKATFNSGAANAGRSGWLGDIAVDYTGLKMMTPSAFFVYSSGEDGNSSKNNKSERMPFLGNPQTWAVGSFFFGDRDFANGFGANDGYFAKTQGFWTAGVSLKDITFIDKLKHTAHVLYVKGTNDKDSIKDNYNTAGNALYTRFGGYLTEKDSLWEVDFNTKYMIYDELSVYLNLGYIAQSFDKSLWRASSMTTQAGLAINGNVDPTDAYRVGLGVTYAF